MATLQEVVEKIWELAERQPNINTIIKSNDIFDLNSMQDAKYAAFCLTQQPHTQDEDFLYFNFYLYYADRLRSDKSNRLEIQSHSISTLKNIIAGLEEETTLAVSQITYTPFTQKFEAETAGAYAAITVSTPLDTICEEEYN